MHDFVFDREEVCLVLACGGVGFDDDTFVLVMHFGIAYLVFQCVFGQVLRVTDDISGVIALQLQNQLDVITQVVLAQSLSERQRCLVETAHYTTGQTHLRHVPYAHTRQVFG